ncbi:hypothetical protein G3M48_006979 [Beauveria asiatica]|uniref:Uncharacterized protein n=1 Tax=Beauveria asiatica TaxID=1069075 RepID=A0AAW0RNI1_9HYPO
MISLASLTVQTPTVLKVLAEKYLKTLEFDSEVLQSLDYKLRHSVAGDVAAGHERTMYYIDDYTAYKA